MNSDYLTKVIQKWRGTNIRSNHRYSGRKHSEESSSRTKCNIWFLTRVVWGARSCSIHQW